MFHFRYVLSITLCERKYLTFLDCNPQNIVRMSSNVPTKIVRKINDLIQAFKLILKNNPGSQSKKNNKINNLA